MERLDPSSSLLLLVDLQERLVAAMPQPQRDRAIGSAALLIEAARTLGVPVVVTEQYRKGLGPTVPELAVELTGLGVEPIDKLTFDATSEPRVMGAIGRCAPRTVVVAGVEAHVCVFFTARELVRRGYTVYVVSDAVASRREDHRVGGLALCDRAGAVTTVAETVVFDWLARAGTDAFRALSRRLR
jgi:nicotinamidase-related amidase